jgi:multiple antibiotic resistance protein
MNEYFIPSVFFTLFFVVDPLGLIPVFLTYLSGFDTGRRNRIVVKAVIIALAISIFFILFGNILLKFLGISSAAFLIAGGILLFLISIDMLFARPTRTKVSESAAAAEEYGDISVFPLAIPMLCGPGNIAALLMFSSQVPYDAGGLMLLIAISTVVFLLTMVIMFLSVSLQRLLGETGLSVIQRLMGLILSALAVQFIINGLKQIGIL